MRRTRTTLFTALALFLFGAPHVTAAECTWMLWRHVHRIEVPPLRYDSIVGLVTDFGTAESAEVAQIKRMVRELRDNLTQYDGRDVVALHEIENQQQLRAQIEYVCLPAGIDPR